MSQRKLVSIAFSFRNEEAVLPELLKRLTTVMEELPYDYEFIFVNDDSTDGSLKILVEAMETIPQIRIVTMSARFGVNPCMLAAIRHASGDAIVTMDTDLQDPPELIPKLIDQWDGGADIVHATRSQRDGETAFKLFVTKWAYRVLHFLSDIRIPVDTGMFKLISRRVADIISKTEERDPFLRGLITWAGYRQAQVYYRRERRAGGETHFPLWSKGPAQEFTSGLVSFSSLPLVFFLLLGLAVTTLASFVMALGFLKAVFGAGPSGMFWALDFLFIVGGLQLTGIGVLGLYVSRVVAQVRQRPDYIIKDTQGFPE